VVNRSTRLLLISTASIITDAVLLQVLTGNSAWSAPAARLLSLCAALAIAGLLSKCLPAPVQAGRRPGLLPLIVVSVVLNYGVFAILSMRTPEIQPLVHLAAAWLGTLLFCLFGVWRIRRWRND